MPSLYIAAVVVLIALIVVSLGACLREERQVKQRPAADAPVPVRRPAVPAGPATSGRAGAPMRPIEAAAERPGAAVLPFPASLERRAPGETDLAALAAHLQQQAAALEAEREALRGEIRQLRRALADVAAGRDWAAPQSGVAPVRLARVG